MKKTSSVNNFHGVGRRKSSVARAWLKDGKGDILVNGMSYESYFDTKITRDTVVLPGEISGKGSSVNLNVNVNGGGKAGQAGAVQLAISRALLSFDSELRPKLREYNLLTVDSRLKERKKYGQKAARRKFQFVKR